MSHGAVAEIANTQSEDRARLVVFVYLIDGMIAHYITPISAKLKPGVLRSGCVDVGAILKRIIDGRFENSYLLPSLGNHSVIVQACYTTCSMEVVFDEY